MSAIQEKYMKQLRHRKYMITFARIFVFLGFILLWETAARLKWIDSFIFSSPSRIVKTFLQLSEEGKLFYHTVVTLSEKLLSFGIIILFGVGIAILLWLCKSLSQVLEPYLVLLNSLPKSALAPMIIVWLGNTSKAIIVTAVSIGVFGTILNLYTSFSETDSDKIRLILTLGGSKGSILTKVVLPSSLKTILSNMKVNIGLSLVGVIIGEFLAAKAGLGYLIIYGSQVFKMDWVAMSIVILCVISVILFKAVDLLEKKFT
jgi:NitT/TauT family transport system permease protein